MTKKLIFPRNKNIYKGNLHSHTTRSDGAYSVETVVQGYKEKGYNFLCISDHHNYYIGNYGEDNNFIIIHGMEGGVGYNGHHIHAIADYSTKVSKRIVADEEYPIDDTQSAQETIDEYIAQGNICIVNHPRWSNVLYDELLELDGYLGIEVYNHNVECESLEGITTDYLDYALKRGKRIYAFASDDAHAKDIDKKVSEFFGGWICVCANNLTHEEIVNSIKTGDFYASSGPQIHKIEIIDDEIHVSTSDVSSIAFLEFPGHGFNAYSKDGLTINNAFFKIKQNTKYIRIEVTDFFGKKAWSNPIFF